MRTIQKRVERWMRGGLSRTWLSGLAASAVALLASGCVATVGTEAEFEYGAPVVAVQEVPVDVYAYPSVVYRDGYAYYVRDRWYYNGPRGWVLFRTAPPELASRAHVVRRVPASRARVYEERSVPAYPRAPVERGRRYHPERR